MVIRSYFHHLLCDSYSLRMYADGETVTLDDLKRHLLLLERACDIHVPDHYYRLGLENTFRDIKGVNDALYKGIHEMADYYLEMREGKVYSRVERQNEWQLFLPSMPPLVLVAAMLQRDGCLQYEGYMEFLRKRICPNVCYTAIPSPYIRQMEDLRKQRKGLHDLHIHLNGALETDWVWQDFLEFPNEIYEELTSAYSKGKVKEHYEQISPFLSSPLKFRKILDMAFRLREELYECVVEKKEFCPDLKKKLKEIILEKQPIGSRAHPMKNRIRTCSSPMQLECLFYVLVLDALQKPGTEYLGGLFHFYLLILGLANQLLVQPLWCSGFEEFQKYTLNGMREWSEKQYIRRFRQLAGNRLNNIRFIEGRFSPKNEKIKNEKLLSAIRQGWEELAEKVLAKELLLNKRLLCNEGLLCNQRLPLAKRLLENEDQMPTLRLIAHFIKEPDKHPDDFIRYKMLRISLKQKANVLVNMKQDKHPLIQCLAGIDAAASEFDTPPEVFAPVFRYLRKEGFTQFTFHAGEDFFHILSGLRAIYEAIVFLELKRCDRIGHATACGISVGVWRENMGSRMYIRKGEHLDNLVFAYHLLSSSFCQCELAQRKLPKLIEKINEYSYDIYEKYYPPYLLQEAWLMRKEDPYQYLAKEKEEDKKETLFLRYHERRIVEKCNEIIAIDTYEIFEEEELHEMQLAVLKKMHDEEIVIETLPTSNVIIGHHQSFETYHLYNWYRWGKEGHPVPPIVVGTDDTGIFATNIYNEYCNIYSLFLYEKKMNVTDVLRFIEYLDENSRLYRFDSCCFPNS